MQHYSRRRDFAGGKWNFQVGINSGHQKIMEKCPRSLGNQPVILKISYPTELTQVNGKEKIKQKYLCRLPEKLKKGDN